ncbi:hypothetical protein ACFRR6_31730 [Streptomyces sp. NPDC056891]|uniref:hypothetical protein n=1 Tax=Streptomyces sp. NPDC056891 TaxID=3345961 RepID=UPI0036CC9D52
MMEELRAIGQQAIGDFRYLLGFPYVHGLLIETDPDLRRLWEIRTTMAADEWAEFDTQLARFYHFRLREFRYELPPSLWPLLPDQGDNVTQRHETPPADLSWRCQTLDEMRRTRGRGGPEQPGVLFTTLYEPSIPLGVFEELSSIASGLPWRVRLAARRPAVAFAGPREKHRPLLGGVSLGQTGRAIKGTLGGFLNLNGDRYAVTCGHVISASRMATQPSEPDGGTGMVISDCLHTSDEMLFGADEPCRGAGSANSIDAAIVRVDSSILIDDSILDLGPVSRTVPMSEVVEGGTVQVSARSGLRNLIVGALALRRSVSIAGKSYCFQDLLELRRPGGNWGVRGSLVTPTRRGDSGSWVVQEESDGYGWVGMVTAGDGPASYAQFAEIVENWAKSMIDVEVP